MTCYKPGCEGVLISVTLGQEDEIHPSFVRGRGVGRLHWRRNAATKGFSLGKTMGGSGYRNCPNCNTLFGNVVVISRGKQEATAFGYDPEPA